MDEERVQLMVMGLSYNQIQDGAYALMLAEVNGPYRVPVVIGTAEAQAIAVVLENMVTPRPLTHDLFPILAELYNFSLQEVLIYSFQDGIFASKMIFSNEYGDLQEIDTRTSDAIAIAIRMKAPIFTTRELLTATGFILEKKGPGTGKAYGHSASGFQVEIEWNEDGSNEIEEKILGMQPLSLEERSYSELQAMMESAVEEEDYELAAKIKNILSTKKPE